VSFIGVILTLVFVDLLDLDQIDAHREMKRLLEKMDRPIKRMRSDLMHVKDNLQSKVLVK
jgi:hypothetical protein